MTAILGASFGSLATLFTQDIEVLQVVRTGVLVCMVLFFFVSNLCLPHMFMYIVKTHICDCCQFVSASQPLNALAYIFDGLHYGVSDFRYAAFSMVSFYVEICYNVPALVIRFARLIYMKIAS